MKETHFRYRVLSSRVKVSTYFQALVSESNGPVNKSYSSNREEDIVPLRSTQLEKRSRGQKKARFIQYFLNTLC